MAGLGFYGRNADIHWCVMRYWVKHPKNIAWTRLYATGPAYRPLGSNRLIEECEFGRLGGGEDIHNQQETNWSED